MSELEEPMKSLRLRPELAEGLRSLLQGTPRHLGFLDRDTNVRFSAELRRLQSLPKCERLPLPSFLLLPFQRITRLRMLLQVLFWLGACSVLPTLQWKLSPGLLV